MCIINLLERLLRSLRGITKSAENLEKGLLENLQRISESRPSARAKADKEIDAFVTISFAFTISAEAHAMPEAKMLPREDWNRKICSLRSQQIRKIHLGHVVRGPLPLHSPCIMYRRLVKSPPASCEQCRKFYRKST